MDPCGSPGEPLTFAFSLQYFLLVCVCARKVCVLQLWFQTEDQTAGGKCVERQRETEQSLGSGVLTRAENLSLPHCSSAQHTTLRTEHDTHQELGVNLLNIY